MGEFRSPATANKNLTNSIISRRLLTLRQITSRAHVFGVAAYKVALGDLIWLQHVPVFGVWGEEEWEGVGFSVQLHDSGVHNVTLSPPYPLDPPRIVGGFAILKTIGIAGTGFVLRKDVSGRSHGLLVLVYLFYSAARGEGGKG